VGLIWRARLTGDALPVVSFIYFYCCFGITRDEIHMLDKVVECVVKRVKKTEWHVAKYPTGLDEKVKDFETESSISTAEKFRSLA
jgi:hypothetical protein